MTRAADLPEVEGTQPIRARITGLPMAMDDGTVRVRVEPLEGQGEAEGSLPVAADVRVALEVPEADRSLRPADSAELESARASEAHLRNQLSQYDRELARISNLRVLPRPAGAEGEPPRESPTHARLALVALREAREQAIRDEQAEVRQKLEEATRKRALLEDMDRRASSARQARAHELRKTVLVTLRRGQHDRRARICVEYQVSGARWAPAYSVQLDDAMSRAGLSLRAHVAQNTGEDWSGVELTLSTADAQRWTELPELGSLRIGRRQPVAPKRGWRPPPEGVDDLYRDYDSVFRPGLLEGEATGELEAEEAAPVAGYPSEADDTGKVVTNSVMFSLDASADFDEAETAVAEPPMAPAPPALSEREDTDLYAPSPVMAPPMMEAKRSRGGLGALFGRAHRASAKERAPEPSSTIGAPQSYGAGVSAALAEAAPGGMAPAEGPALAASTDMLSYGTLRMPPASAADRGRLTIAAQHDVYLELLVSQRISVTLDEVEYALRAAADRTQSVEHAPLPPRCRPAWSEDYDYAYVAESSVDVPSDGDFHSIPIRSGEAAAEPLYVVVPRESTDVYRTVEIENPIDAPLLPGPIDVYWRGDFLLTSEVDFTPPRAKVRLGLGVEQAIKVSRNTRFREESAGLMGGSLDLRHQILIEALNHTKRSVALEVRERIPVIRDDEEEIRLDVKEVSPPWEDYDPFPSAAEAAELRGGHRWRLRLEPGRTENLKVSYTVRIPAKLELIGGNRREV